MSQELKVFGVGCYGDTCGWCFEGIDTCDVKLPNSSEPVKVHKFGDRKEYHSVDDFPDWAKDKADQLLVEHGASIEERYGIPLESVVITGKLSEREGRIDFNTSIGCIPFQVIRPRDSL